MPTYNRRAFVPQAIMYFLRQDYAEKELIIIDDGTDNISDLIPDIPTIRYYRLEKKITLGAKMNLACSYANGSIVVNWDDDDWYASWRISYQVAAMNQPGSGVCGINNLFYLDTKNKEGFRYIYPSHQRVWLLGSSLCYTKELWNRNKFADINVGMDGLFVWATPPEQVKVLDDSSFSVHIIHSANVSPKNTRSGYWHPYPLDKLKQVLGTDWHFYSNGFTDKVEILPDEATKPTRPEMQYKQLRNVYACLVHENEDCIIDLVRNLRYHDPESLILLYNGSENPMLLNQDFPYEKYGAYIHPSPVPQKHGYLHTFALDCMAYALENFTFDIFTIVDSDQLAIRSGYSDFMSRYFSTVSNVGMLSGKPERVLPDDKTNHVASQAFKEYDLWKSFLGSFPEGDKSFVHWTFWPSTVFTASAIRDLLGLFSENKQLQVIMQKTKIWATEEVIFPTLIRLLGYEIGSNPCSYDFVKYRKNFLIKEMPLALNRTDVYWLHPVERRYENPLRTYVRKQFSEYSGNTGPIPDSTFTMPQVSDASVLLQKINHIEGWLSEKEAETLISFSQKVCLNGTGLPNIVEIGSYQGKSTVLFASVLKNNASRGKVYAIDTHDGKLGALDLGLKSYTPSLAGFQRNIAKAELQDNVKPIIARSVDVHWQLPVSILFIDGLHDYPNVARDFWHFEKWLQPGGFVAFHDYADYFPGVKAFVDELCKAGTYQKFQKAETLIVLQKGQMPKTTLPINHHFKHHDPQHVKP